jgi:tRNA A37 threonylcarbamoyladenosine dehydratase
MNEPSERFSGIARLFSADGLERLRRAHVCVVGIGGVGSWAVEALARSGLGALTMVDLDDVCLSNVNRQVHALDGAVGRPKVEVMAKRVQAINPACALHSLHTFFTARNAQEILQTPFDYVLDAIDNPAQKCLLIASCRDRRIPILVAGAAGGRRDPANLRVADLAFSTHDRLLQAVRSKLRSEFGFPQRREPFGVDCVFSPESVVYPRSDGSVCAKPESGSILRLDCASGYGTACFVTGAFGFVAAAHVVQAIAGADKTPK